MKNILFFLIVIFVLLAMNYYFFFKLQKNFHLSDNLIIFSKIILYILVFSPFLLKTAEAFNYLVFAKVLAYPVYLWLCFIFLFLVFGLLLDFLHIMNLINAGKIAFILPLCISLLIIIYGFYEASNIKIHTVQIKSSKIAKNYSPLKIVQISDLHLGLLTNEGNIKKIIKKIKNLNPHIVVCTGDLVDGEFFNGNNLKDIFLSLTPEYGKYCVTGNHEYYAGIDKSITFIKDSGFILLQNEVITLPNLINITGVNDETDPNSNLRDTTDIDEKLFTLLLKHRPDTNDNLNNLIDLQLSGHTHAGQVFPFNFLTYIFYPIKCSNLITKKDRQIYVNPGTGTWGPPIRFLAPPEITLIEIIAE